MSDGVTDGLREIASRHDDVRPRGAIDVLAGVLRQALTAGLLAPGVRLNEGSLSEALSVSRNTLREALRVLEVERLVVREPFRGVFVRRLGRQDIADLFSVRRLVEVGAVRVAGRADPEVLTELREAVGAARRHLDTGDVAGLGTADLRFHAALAELSGSPRLREFMTRIHAELRLSFGAVRDPLDFHRGYVDRNEELCSLVEQGRFGEAAAGLERYLLDAEADLVDRL